MRKIVRNIKKIVSPFVAKNRTRKDRDIKVVTQKVGERFGRALIRLSDR